MKSIITTGRRFVLALLLFTTAANAQFDGLFTQYMFNEVFINPAYAGSKEAMSATLLHRQQWVSFAGRPVSTSFSMHGPLMDNRMGVGLSLLNEKIGVLSRNLIYGSYAYRIKLDDKQTLSMGLMAGMETQTNKLGQLKVGLESSPTDPQFLQNSPNVVAPNAGLGFYYKNEQLYAGISIPRLIDNSVKFSSSGASIKTTRVAAAKFTYYLTGGYLFTLNEDLKLRANAMVKLLQNAPTQVDLGGNFLIKEQIWAGLSYRSNSAVSVLLGAQINQQFMACYSYDYGTNKLQQHSLGSHEIVINYLFSFSGKKVATPRYF
jgi:type IX secretion system PorP/SprF family membrane protein